MSDLHYLKPKADEIYNVLIVSFVFALMFSMLTVRFAFVYLEVRPVLIQFFVFFLLLFFSRLLIMKYVALRNAFEFNFELTYLNKIGLYKYDTLGHKIGKIKKYTGTKNLIKAGYKGIPMIVLSLVMYIFSMGFLIWPAVWKFSYKRIPHLHQGKSQYWETVVIFYRNTDISLYRRSKAYLVGFFWYFVFGFLLKVLFIGEIAIYNWMVFALYWIAFFTLIPIPGSDGFELYLAHRFGWLMMLTTLTLGMLSLIVFDNFLFVIMVMIFVAIFVFFNQMWKKLV